MLTFWESPSLGFIRGQRANIPDRAMSYGRSLAPSLFCYLIILGCGNTRGERPSVEVIICMTWQTCRLLCHLSIVPESTALNSRPKLVILEFYRRPDYWGSVKFIVTYQLMILFSRDNLCVSYASVLENEAVP